ncbi:hypothetical protein NQS96_07810 [Pseudoalteromonas shioyasakiensis]|uniref:hypothetical protein n=2 Tax=Pseudoalteromonas TaxID=53246 RepID=UPI002117ABA9|nr:hypothetical protein [Pseudoalteromonas shioyasakiensis]MCQ8881700.1 hypothetical protein [Pseudoalteromonas shioyasakiensis]|tara:strand:+ start:30398 stop:30661 length:264 start_codon:yes stop_codon:yes gene_type:complete
MLNVFTSLVINQLKQRINFMNQRMQGEELRIYESGTKYCLIILFDINNQVVLGSIALNASARRDLCMTKAFLSLIENTRIPKAVLAA